MLRDSRIKEEVCKEGGIGQKRGGREGGRGGVRGKVGGREGVRGVAQTGEESISERFIG